MVLKREGRAEIAENNSEETFMAEIKQGLRRSPALMSRFDTALLVVDVQEKLLNLMYLFMEVMDGVVIHFGIQL